MSNASSDDASLTSSGAICTPTANPTAATHSQNSFRPKNKIATPMSTPTIVTEECMGKGEFRPLQRRGGYAKHLFLEFRRLLPRFRNFEIQNSNVKQIRISGNQMTISAG